jgi:hypothetical protein
MGSRGKRLCDDISLSLQLRLNIVQYSVKRQRRANRDLQGSKIIEDFTTRTEPNAWIARIHSRLPMILPHCGVEPWLDPRIESRRAFGLGEDVL